MTQIASHQSPYTRPRPTRRGSIDGSPPSEATTLALAAAPGRSTGQLHAARSFLSLINAGIKSKFWFSAPPFTQIQVKRRAITRSDSIRALDCCRHCWLQCAPGVCSPLSLLNHAPRQRADALYFVNIRLGFLIQRTRVPPRLQSDFRFKNKTFLTYNQDSVSSWS